MTQESLPSVSGNSNVLEFGEIFSAANMLLEAIIFLNRND